MKSVKTQLKKFQHFYPYTVALVGAQAGKRVNFMSCAWHTALSFECRLAEARPYGDHDLFVGEVLAVHEDAHAFNSEDVLNPMKVRPLLYLGSDFYITIDPDTFKHVLPD